MTADNRDRPFPIVRAKKDGQSIVLGSATAAAEFIERQKVNIKTDHWAAAMRMFNLLKDGGRMRDFRNAMIEALSVEGWLEMQTRLPHELEEMLLAKCRENAECRQVRGIAIVYPVDRPWDIAPVRDGPMIDDGCWRILKQEQARLVSLYDVFDAP